jgi:4'-phosphopantetheinyl transferase EntD
MPQVIFDFFDDSKKVVVWKITENINELENLSKEKFFIPNELNSWVENRKLQWLSSRILLKKLLPNIELIYSQEKGPIITKENIFVSVSHTNFYSCAVVSQNTQVGIDIEEISNKAKKISKKFFHPSEFNFLAHTLIDESSFYTMLWTIKEAIFKKFHYLHLIFSQEIILKSLNKNENFMEAVVTVIINSLPEEVNTKIFKIDNHYLCVA